MLTKNINFKKFYKKKKKKKYFLFSKLLKEDNEILNSSKNTYKNSYNRNLINKFKNFQKLISFNWDGWINIGIKINL